MKDIADLTAERRDGLDRRTIIKRAAAAGALAWTAPAIIGSIASPAGATTVAHGCYDLQVTQGSGTSCVTENVSAGTCQPANYTTHAAFGATNFANCITSTACGSAPNSITFTIGDQCSCLFVAGSIQRLVLSPFSLTCVGGTLGGSPVGKTITFTKATGSWISAARITVRCGDGSC